MKPARPLKRLWQDRDISTLSFNERVLQEAEDERNPLMERVRFLGIYSSNMDEFFKVRVASVHRMIEIGHTDKSNVLDVVAQRSRELDQRFQAAYHAIIKALASEGIRLLTEADIKKGSELDVWLRDHFRQNILPSLVPLLIDEAQDFPQLMDGELYFAVKMRGETPRYAILRIPTELGRFVELPSGDIMYIDDAIRHSLDDVFYIFEYKEIEAFEFKILRDAELDMDNDFSEDYVRKMEQELQSRKGGRPTRMVYDAAIPPVLLRLLTMELRIGDEYPLIGGARYHNMRDLVNFPIKRPDLSWPEASPVPHPVLDRGRTPMIEMIREQDLLLTAPYQNFDHIVRLLREAAIDPKVEAIKMSLYRVARNSRIVNALVNAAQNGKWVFVSVELQARFDEKNNINMAERLQEAGAHVVFGLPPMKVHCKLLLIQKEGIQFAALSTGNFHEGTAHTYVDSTLFTADPRLTAEVDEVFEYLERASRMRVLASPNFKHLVVSPFNLRKAFSRLVDAEIAKRDKGYLCIKVNHLTDEAMIKKIRRAADAGVKIDLVVRTTYAMSPHPNIRAVSILDRYLEHQRIYIFGRGEAEKIYVGSSDLMERNLDWRVEVAFPVYDEALREDIRAFVGFQLEDDYKARYYDETQSNPYVGGKTGTRRAQALTRAYLEAKATGIAQPIPAPRRAR